jgi:hypothetical protein
MVPTTKRSLQRELDHFLLMLNVLPSRSHNDNEKNNKLPPRLLRLNVERELQPLTKRLVKKGTISFEEDPEESWKCLSFLRNRRRTTNKPKRNVKSNRNETQRKQRNLNSVWDSRGVKGVLLVVRKRGRWKVRKVVVGLG